MCGLRFECVTGTPTGAAVPVSPRLDTLGYRTTLTLFRSNPKSLTPKIVNQYSASATSTGAPHPWPEWVSFVDRLNSRGYFPESVDEDADLVYREFDLLKGPCLSFARDRYDLFGSLSKDDIQNVVEVGCPKLIRKVVNSAKRLRVYVGLEEKNVCDACSLRGSCDRAYLKPNESESVRTVDIMRLLLFYVLDPMVISEAVRRSSIEQTEFSARRLLSMLTDQSESSKDPTSIEPPLSKEKIIKSTATALSEATDTWKGEWVCSKCSFLNYSRNTQCRKCNEDGPKKQGSAPVVPMKGDWKCPQCKYLNYVRNIRCRQCNEDAPKKRERKHVEAKQGDWRCSLCNFLNYARNIQCRKCNEDAPANRKSLVAPKRGDWDCTQCEFVNFASRTNCLKCSATRPPQSLNMGEWVCSKCYFLNFRRNATCLKCDSEPVKDAVLHEHHTWTKPTPNAMS